MRPSRLATALAALALLPAAAGAERIAPLSPPDAFPPQLIPGAPPPAAPAPAVPAVPSPPAPIVPAPAQPAPADDPFARGVDALLGNIFKEMQPTFDSMAKGLDGAVAKFGPALNELGRLVDDIRNYEPPERLANGDILIRRRAGAPPPPPIDQLRDLTTPDPEAPAAAPQVPANPAPPPVDPAAPQIDL